MKNEIVTNSCRICLTKTKKLRSLYKPVDEGDEPPNEMLHLITGIKVEKLDEFKILPKNICKNCELSLSMAFEFRENALKTQQIILTYLKELQDNESNDENKTAMALLKNEYEEMMNLEPLDCVDTLEEDIHNLNNPHKFILDNEELDDDASSEDDTIEKDEFYNQQESSYLIGDSKDSEGEIENTNYENYLDQQYMNNEEEQTNTKEFEPRMCDEQEEIEYSEQVEFLPAKDNDNAFNQKKLDKASNRKSNKKKSSRVCKKLDRSIIKITDIYSIENVKSIPRRGRKPSNTNNQCGHICDICGNVFAKRGRMMEHRQRHDKECRFSCEICDKKFLSRELLRKHMFSHSGGKPLKCEYCSRTFYYESVRKAHEAVHKGLKPYICDDCGKGFSYAHALKKHKLIHAEIKLYRCEYCNKDFRLQHHMKQHELTKLHQNAVRFANNTNISIEDCGEMIKGEQDLNEDTLFIEEMADDHLVSAT